MASPLLVRVKWRARSRVKWRARSWVQCLLGVCNYQIKKIEIRWLACFFGRIFSNGISFPCLLDSHVFQIGLLLWKDILSCMTFPMRGGSDLLL